MEVVHPIHGHGPSACPKCGGKMKKAYAPPAVVFKGSGWARKERSHRPARTSSAEKPADKPASSEGGAGTHGGEAGSSEKPKPAKQDAD